MESKLLFFQFLKIYNLIIKSMNKFFNNIYALAMT